MEKVFDPLRKIEVALTPEEAVRQSAIRWLHEQLGVPMELMMSEWAFRSGQMQYRADIVVFGRDLKPMMLVECKAPSVKLDREVIEQGIRYNAVLKVRYMVFLNGVKMCFFERVGEGPEYRMLSVVPEITI